jgi:hypothetical protein
MEKNSKKKIPKKIPKIPKPFMPKCKFGGSRPAGLGGVGKCTYSTQRLSQIIIVIWQSRQVSSQLAHIEGATCPRTYMVYIP